MEFTITTPALLFPAISLLMLAYTNRFLVVAQVIRDLNRRIDRDNIDITREQLSNLSHRLSMIKWMQGLGVSSFILCTLSMFALFIDFYQTGKWAFGISLVLLVISLVVSLYEIHISSGAIKSELKLIDRFEASQKNQ